MNVSADFIAKLREKARFPYFSDTLTNLGFSGTIFCGNSNFWFNSNQVYSYSRHIRVSFIRVLSHVIAVWRHQRKNTDAVGGCFASEQKSLIGPLKSRFMQKKIQDTRKCRPQPFETRHLGIFLGQNGVFFRIRLTRYLKND